MEGTDYCEDGQRDGEDRSAYITRRIEELRETIIEQLAELHRNLQDEK